MGEKRKITGNVIKEEIVVYGIQNKYVKLKEEVGGTDWYEGKKATVFWD